MEIELNGVSFSYPKSDACAREEAGPTDRARFRKKHQRARCPFGMRKEHALASLIGR